MRQFIFSILAVAVAVGLYFLLKPYVGTETVSWMCILGAAPFAALGFITYHGMTAEQFIWAWMYYADLGRGIGSEQEGYRPVVIIQNNVGNKHSPTVIIASITSKTGVKAKLPTHYYIDAEDGLELPSIVLLEQLRTVDKRRLGNFIGHLSEKHICGINHALAVSIGLIESVPKKLILCLCSTCADNFYGTGAYYLRRIDPVQVAKDTCTYCNQRKGYDYELVPKKR